MQHPKYHIYIKCAQKSKNSAIRFNLLEEEIIRTFVTPYKEGKPFWFCGKLLSPEKVDEVIIFRSYQDGSSLVLPNREMVAGHPDKELVMEKICIGKVKGVSVCTEKFLGRKQKTNAIPEKE